MKIPIKKERSEWQSTAHNERFGVSGGVTRPNDSAILQVLFPCKRQ